MPTEEDMTVTERRKYLKRMKVRYTAAPRGERGRLLTEMQQVSGLHRKSLTRLMHAPSLERKPRTKQRERTYGLATEQVIVRVWESRDYICAERLTPGLLSMAQHLAGFEPLGLTDQVEDQLATISRATVARLLRKHRSQMRRLPQKGAERANSATAGVPMGRIPWDTQEPGHFEVDLVFHSGASLAGLHGHTIQLLDVATGWSERVAVLGRGQQAMEGGFERIVERLPFPIKELHPDNGSEFFNAHLVRYWQEKVKGVQLSCSRPWHKNDNRMVEQKNATLVRQYLGDLRLDTPEQIAALNALYEDMWLYYNLFQPVLHLCEKQVIAGKVVRKWDTAKTPYERLLESSVLSPEQQARLRQLYEQTNPHELREALYRQLDTIWQSAMAPPTSAARSPEQVNQRKKESASVTFSFELTRTSGIVVSSFCDIVIGEVWSRKCHPCRRH